MNNESKNTKEKILDSAHSLVLDHGFAGTTIDAVIKQARVSKGAFFHYFSNKNELGYILVQQYAERDAEHLDTNMAKAEDLSDDPLQQLLIFVKLFEQEMKSLQEPFPGCLFASYLNNSELFDEKTLGIIRESMLAWRSRLLDKLEEVVKKHPLQQEIDLKSLADMMMVTFEGSFVLSQSLNDPQIIARQLSQYHLFLKLLFE
jgi:TetR/AcrR family transcriptional regulator, transcriptional repressor for nem operon